MIARISIPFIAALLLAQVSFADGHGYEHGYDAHAAEYDSAKGVELSPETASELGVKLQTPLLRQLCGVRRLSAVVVSVRPKLVASAKVRADISNADDISFADAKLLRVDRSLFDSDGFVELLFELPDGKKKRNVGDFVDIELSRKKSGALTVPNSAVLDCPRGKFVYVFADGHFKKTPVKSGLRDADFCEILDGVSPSDKVVVSAAERLLLVELRLVNGGSHSH